MDRKLFGIFSGRQLTLLAMTAMLAPGVLVAGYAIPSFTNVAIEDPVSGQRAAVDAARRIYVYDSINAYATTPANFVKISVVGVVGVCNAALQKVYTVPSGKALILRSVNMTYYGGTSGNDNYIYLYEGNSSGNPIGFITGYDNSAPSWAQSFDLGNGYALPSGETVVYACSDGAAAEMSPLLSLEGYLVPAGAVPAAGTAEAAAQNVRIGAFQPKRRARF